MEFRHKHTHIHEKPSDGTNEEEQNANVVLFCHSDQEDMCTNTLHVRAAHLWQYFMFSHLLNVKRSHTFHFTNVCALNPVSAHICLLRFKLV